MEGQKKKSSRDFVEWRGTTVTMMDDNDLLRWGMLTVWQ